jgi:acyl-CoA synthetase (NDP forming)
MSSDSRGFVLEPEAVAILRQYGIPYPECAVARNAGEAVSIAERIGYPVALKVVSPDVMHKSDAGGVVVGLGDAPAVTGGYGRLMDSVLSKVPGAKVEGALVCQQAPAGLEAIVGAIEDSVFGPTIMFGLGGIFAEALKDVTFRIVPLERRDAEEMIREIKGYLLLTGARGQKPCDVEALVDLLLAVSKMVFERGDVKELDLNPVRLYERGVMALDARLLLKK